MSGLDNKKSKRRKVKKTTVTKAATQNRGSTPEARPSSTDGEALMDIEKMMDSPNGKMVSFPRTKNPFLLCEDNAMKMQTFWQTEKPIIDHERCLLCNCQRQDPPEAEKILAETNANTEQSSETNPLSQLPLWVCPSCRKAADQEMEKKPSLEQFLEKGFNENFLPDISIKPGSEPTTPNGTLCTCEACTERRVIEDEHEQETQDLQHSWMELRKVVRHFYGSRENMGDKEINANTIHAQEEKVKDLVHKLNMRDPHQLFLRLESQVVEFVIEMKVKLLKQLSTGFKTPPQAKKFISMLLDEYTHLCTVARKMAGLLKELQDHLKRFKVTWDLHNKHLFQSVVFSEPPIKNSMTLLLTQLRLGAASKESYTEDTYPNLLHRYLKFEDEMSVINVVWRDCHQLIESYNEEQSALKLKQKMLREDWEFFKTQRKLLEKQVTKNSSKSCLSHNLEAQFTETMRLMLQGNKPSQDELLCPRCNRKRCPCDECTITHMITCGIINPEVLENTNTAVNTHHHNTPFMHDPNRYRIDVSPPSMSSTTSSSGSSSPIMVDPHPFIGNLNEDENQEENDNQSYEEDDDDDVDDDDLDADGDDEEEEEEEGEELEEEEEFTEMKEEPESEPNPFKIMEDFTIKDGGGVGVPFGPETKIESCNCDHCVSQARQAMKVEENPCQCHVCLKQQGKDISTSLPQPVPPIVPKPGELHLYPHIHGSTGLHTLGRGRPILQPNLYDLHLPTSQRHKSIIQQTKVPIKLDFDSPEGINDHIYHAYGDWDNTPYDPRLLLGNGKLDSELLPPPPFSSPYMSNLLKEPFSMAGGLDANTSPIISSISSSSAFTSSVSNQTTTSTVQAAGKITDNLSVLTTKETLGEHLARNAKCVNQDISMAKNHTPPCTRPATMGGNNVPKMTQKGHSQHCRKHNPQANVKTGTLPNHNHTGQLPMKMDGRQMVHGHAPKQPTNHAPMCNHGNKNNNNRPHLHAGAGEAPDDPHLPMSMCSGSVQLPTTVNNVSVGTSTLCAEPGCDGCHDDNYDSIDDNCSEQSSSTSNSNSNQKDGKYCDCCYCEFFGHGNPPVAPTSKNYAEMRDKLRLRLKKKQTESKSEEQQQDDDVPLGNKGVDELIEYINGTDNNKKVNTKAAAKRARQKLKKEKAKLEAEEEQKKQQALREAELIRFMEMSNMEAKKHEANKRKEKEVLTMMTREVKSQSSSLADRSKRKKGKHKEDEMQNLQVRITCEIEHESDPASTGPSNPGSKVMSSNHSNNINSSQTSSSIQLPVCDRHKMVRPCPQGSSAPTVPITIDNRAVINNRTNKNKEPGRSLDMMNGEMKSNAKNLQSNQIPLNNKQIICQNDKGKKSNNKLMLNDRPPSATDKMGLTPSIIDLQEVRMASKSSSPSPRTQERNNNKQNQKQSQCTNNTAAPDLKQQQQQQLTPQTSRKGKKGSDNPPQSNQNSQNVNNQSNLQMKNQSPPPATPTATPLIQNGLQSDTKQERTRQVPQGQTRNGSATPGTDRKNPGGQVKERQDSPPTEQGKAQTAKSKKKKMKKKGVDEIESIDEVFRPKSMEDINCGEMDELEREIEQFKRFCADSGTPVKREKLQVNVNLRDIFDRKKKNLLSCN